MLKAKITGLPSEVTQATENLNRCFDVIKVSNQEKNRNSSFVRVYIDLDIKPRSCRVCGCTQDNACPGGCYWIAEDLCSMCGGDDNE